MIDMHGGVPSLRGPKGSLPIREDDEITLKLAMLYEGQCEGLGPQKAARKFGYTRQRYHQIRDIFERQGAEGLKSVKRSPKTTFRRTDEVVEGGTRGSRRASSGIGRSAGGNPLRRNRRQRRRIAR